MKLLITTQAVDENDPVLGFFCRWIEEFAKHHERVTVICLKEGTHSLPSNVIVHALGKKGIKRSTLFERAYYAARFVQLIVQFRKQYDAVFIHMNQEYVLLGGLFFRLWGKRIFLWRNHKAGTLATQIAVKLSHKVFYTSPQSFTARFKNSIRMPVGIDTHFFKPDTSVHKKPNSILFLGRIAPVKKVHVFVEALKKLRDSGVTFSVTIAGEASLQDEDYRKMIFEKVKKYHLEDKVVFVGAVSQTAALQLYREHQLYVNLTPAGSMDKTIFEAMACGAVPVVCNVALAEVLDEDLIATASNPGEIAHSIVYARTNHVQDNLRDFVVKTQSLTKLCVDLKHEIDLHNI